MINPYIPFTNFILRTPLFALDFYKTLTAKDTISIQELKRVFNNPIIREAIFLASPPLYEELIKWSNANISEIKKEEKLNHSLLKYLSRMSSRCTPFGLFAGCAVGELGDKTKITIGDQKDHTRHTRLDMNYLVALSQNLAREAKIKEQLLFFPNTSIYKVGNQLRYVEYKYVNSNRQHHIVAVDNSDYLNKILQAAKEGLKLNTLASLLVDNEITIKEAKAFIDELVESQLLISELEPSVSGPEFLDQILQVLFNLKDVEPVVAVLKEVEKTLQDIDSSIGNPIDKYIFISKKLKELKTDFDLKYLFQTDLILKPTTNTLDIAVVDSVKNGISLFNKITLPPKDTFLNQFKQAFYERFEEREVSLSTALDVETGIGYKQNQNSTEVNPLVDDLILPFNNILATQDIKWSPIDAVFQNKIFKAIASNDYILRLSDTDFKDFEENWNDLPDTISAMIEIVIIDGEQKIKFSNIGGSSAGNFLGRFCHGDKQLNKHTQQIIDFETKSNKDKLLAEIIHLPESRLGNILMRPSFRNFEIPYLAKSILSSKQQLPIEDLSISVRNDNIVLKSEKYSQQVIPHLTNAHNYSANALPVYQFLCDMQTQGKRGFLGINLGPFANEYEFIPRIEYENLILSEATWNLKNPEIEPLLKAMDNDRDFSLVLKKFKQEKKIPQFALLTEGDNELLINFENLTSVKMLLQTVKKRPHFKLTEFLFNENGVVKSNDGKAYYTNQVVLSFYNSKKVKQ